MVGKSDNDKNRARPDIPAPARGPRPPEGSERIAKAIARAGLCSRREAEAWIAAGRVAVNGATIASPAVNIGPSDRVTVDGEPLPERERTRLFLYYKPVGLVTTHADPQGRPTIFAALPKHLPRLLSVGRLDLTSEGLLLLTNDGGLARVLELPETGWLRRYRVRAHGRVTQADLDKLRAGITVEGINYGPVEATLDREQGSNVWLTVGIREGKNREVRNVLGALDLQVNRLIRVSFGPFQLGELKEGEVEEVRTRHLREQIGERIARLAGCDFTGPMTVRQPEQAAPAPRERPERERPERTRPERERKPRAHSTPRGDEKPHKPRDRVGRDQHRQNERRLHRAGQQPERDDASRPKDGGDRKRSFERSPHRTDERPPRSERPHRRRDEERPAKPPGRPRRGDAWRAEDAPLRRHYRGGGGKEPRAPDATEKPKRAGLLTDRKGRRVLVERFGDAVPKSQERTPKRFGRPRTGQRDDRPARTDRPPRDDRPARDDRPRGKPPRPGKRGRPDKSRDRSRGPRPSRPRER